MLLTRRSVAKKLGLPILGKYVTGAVVGVPPNIMGVGPAYAIPRVLELTGLSKDDIDIYEINEAFASQAVFSAEKLGLDFNKVNPVGGAIALGHPLGCTGSRQIATGLAEAKREKKQLLVTSMVSCCISASKLYRLRLLIRLFSLQFTQCVGSGMGMASVIVNEQ